ncbi:MAG: hypothetical protein JST26_09485 [Bacteroidetes bacterium]|nr:hypothetical protein [Bacteroidota bacterium]
MVEVFKTNIQTADNAQVLRQAILKTFPETDISFDLEDCDRILRIEGRQIDPEGIIRTLAEHGFWSEVLL